jgi:tetratricopeptide (TPR) repeat protein
VLRRSRVLLLASCLACGVRTPARLDVAALVAQQGPVEARRTLALRVVVDPKDVAARLGLAALADQQGRPSEAIEHLEAVVALDGPLGIRWRDDDRARLARLVAARGRARLERGAGPAVVDLQRARELGAAVTADELDRARVAHAVARLRHVDAGERAAGKRILSELARGKGADRSWRGAAATASAAERAKLGEWLWNVGARRAAWDELAAWHDATPARDRNPGLQSSYLVARSWWVPVDAAPPPPAELVGAVRCRYTSAACSPRTLARTEPRDELAIAALVAAPAPRTADPDAAAGWLAITLVQALRGEVAWGAAFDARVDAGAVSPAALPAEVRPTFGLLTGRGAQPDVAPTATALAADRLVIAAGRALRGGTTQDVRDALGDHADSVEGAALLRVVESPAAEPIASPHTAATVNHVRARVLHGPDAAALRPLVVAYRRDPAIADRLGDDVVAGAVDAAVASAALGALFDALGDPARARTAWQAAVTASPEVEHLRGLAGAMARGNDPDAALVTATTAAAASGDPAVVWLAIAKTLDGAGKHVHSLEAARYAIDLGGPATLAGALAVAMSASRALGRHEQVGLLAARRAKLVPLAPSRTDDPTDADAALAEHLGSATASAVARMWVASRWNPRAVTIRATLLAATSPDDPRRRVIIAELVELASDPDPDVGRAAVAALR